MRFILAVLALFLLTPSRGSAQQPDSFPTGADSITTDPLELGTALEQGDYIALTFCVNNVPTTIFAETLIGTPLQDEVVAHEARHRWQMQQRIAAGETCNFKHFTYRLLFADEVDAYCASNVVHLQRNGGDTLEASMAVLDRLIGQFMRSGMSMQEIIQGWLRSGCPTAVAPAAPLRKQ